MARGRSIDKTLQPSRALAQQRDYRARKAARIESLENEVQLLRAENARLRSELREARSGGNDQRFGDAVADVRQYLIHALSAVNALSGEVSVGNERILGGTGMEGGTLLELAERKMRETVGECSKKKEEVVNTGSEGEARYDSACCSGIFDCSSVPAVSTPTQRSAQTQEPHPQQQYPTSSYPNAFRSHAQLSPDSHPSSQITTPPIQPDLIPPIEVGYDTACCGGVMDCSHLPPTVDELEEEEGDDQVGRGISHVRAEGRGR